MPISLIEQGSQNYPNELVAHMGLRAPKRLAAWGHLIALSKPKLALVSSVKCPGSLILKFYDLVRLLRDAGVTVIGGFHSPMEKEALDLLLRGTAPVIVCPAKTIEHGRLPPTFEGPVKEGRLLVVSFFAKAARRATVEHATFRNECVAALADQILFVHASPGGKAAALAQTLRGWGKSIYCIEDEMNGGLMDLGVKPVSADAAGVKCLQIGLKVRLFR